MGAMSASGVPCAHMAFPAGSDKGLPFAVYIVGSSEDQYADNGNRRHISPVHIELYTAPSDTGSAPAVEAALAAEFGAWSRDEELWVDDQNCVETVYTVHAYEREG